MKEYKKNRTLMHKGSILTFYRDDVQLEDGRFTQRDVIKFNNFEGAVHCLCVDEDENIIFTKQRRFNNENTISISTVGGFIEKGEDAVSAMKREVLEETGYDIISYEQVFDIMPLVAYSYERSYLFIVKVKYTGRKQNLDEFEQLSIDRLSVDDFYNLTKTNQCSSMNAKLLINRYRLKKYML